MSSLATSLPELQNFVLAITPTNRQDYLERQYNVFIGHYDRAVAAGIELPQIGWVIVDESPEPSAILQRIQEQDPRILYMHFPDRHDLSGAPESLRDIVSPYLYPQNEMEQRVSWLIDNVCDRVKQQPNPLIASVGEMRNMAIAAGVQHFNLEDTDFSIITKDDDDYTSPEYLKRVHNGLERNVFVKPSKIVIYHKPMDKWFEYDMECQDQEALVVQGNDTETIERYVVWDDADETQPSVYGHLEMLGTLFSYRYSAWQALSADRVMLGEKPGGFEPILWREDHLFARSVFEKYTLDLVTALDTPISDFGRIVDRNNTKTVCHREIDSPCKVEPLTSQSLQYLALANEFEKAARPQDDRMDAEAETHPALINDTLFVATHFALK